jgi:predicted enzyme related to lactoylglutathione lyase
MNDIKRVGCAVFEAFLCSSVRAAPVSDTPAKAPAVRLFAATFMITDSERAIIFCTKGMGLTSEPRNEAPRVTKYPIRFPGGDARLVLMAPKGGVPAPANRPSGSHVILAIPDVKALAARLQAAGYPLLGPIIEIKAHNVVVGVVADPDGNQLELVQGIP